MMKQFFLLFLALFSTYLMISQNQVPFSRELNSNWSFHCQTTVPNLLDGEATVPGNIHMDLLHEELISHPFKGTNELSLQWIQDSTWVYETTFLISEKELEFQQVFLEFEGLDTYARIFLNDLEIGQSDNMFLAWEKDVKSKLNHGENKLKVIFQSPYDMHAETAATMGYQLPASNDAGENKISPWVRKSPYHFGWDWAPKFTTCGIYMPVNLHFKSKIYIEDIYVYTSKLADGGDKAVLTYEITLNQAPSKIPYTISVSDADGIYFEKTKTANTSKIKGKCTISNPKIWWPNGWGEQPLLDFNFNLKGLVQHSEKIGIRTALVRQQKDKTGQSFYFKINGQELFAKGANYIPQDVFVNNKSVKDYEKLILQAKDANFNMLRVWGGGIYERDIFYELCDKHGILVWQDLMFACSMYPGDESFLESVSKEITYQVKRLRNHPCVAHWNGNNEVNVAWHNWGWQTEYDLDSLNQIEIKANYDRVFRDLIPETIEDLDKRTYTHTSPLSNWGPKGDFNSGSMHYWGVWHNKEPFENYGTNVGRFMSEYGFQSFPSKAYLAEWIPEDSLFLASESMTHRQKSYIGNGLISDHISQYFPEPQSFNEFVELSQITQAIAYENAIEAHRFERPHCMGTLYWQLNDCWPGPSWSTVDYSGNEKAAHSKVKEMYQNVLPIMKLELDKLITFISNDTNSHLMCTITVQLVDTETGEILNSISNQTALKPMSTSWVHTDDEFLKVDSKNYYIHAEISVGGEVISKRNTIPNWQMFSRSNDLKTIKQIYLSQ